MPRPVLLVAGAAAVEAATKVAGGVYDVANVLTELLKGETFEGKKVLLWYPGEGDYRPFDSVGEQAAVSAAEVKFMMPNIGAPLTPQKALADHDWKWKDFYEYAQPLVKLWSNGSFRAQAEAFHGKVPASPASVLDLAHLDSSPDEPADDEHDAEAAFMVSVKEVKASERLGTFHGEQLAEDEWPEPRDLWDAPELPPIKREWLPEPIAAYALDQAALIGCDPVQMAVNCMTVASACIREEIALQMLGDSPRWKEKARLWGAVVGEPSSKKGPALDAATGYFQHLSAELRKRQEQELANYQIEAKIHEKQMAAYIAAAAKGDPSASRPTPPEKPLSERLWTDDPTKEAVALLLSSHARGKLTIIKDELAGWFGSFDAYSSGKGEKDKPDWLSSYEGKERFIDRARDGGTAIHVPRWSVCVLGGIQPSVIAKIAQSLGGDGMLQRFQIVVAGPATEGEERRPDGAAIERWHRILTNLLGLSMRDDLIRFSPEAQQLRKEVGRWIQKASGAGLSPALSVAVGKWEGLFGRLCLTAHCIHAADAERITPEAEVSIETARQAWAYMQNILWPHALQFYENQAPADESRWRWFAGLILVQRLNEVSTTFASRYYSGYRHLNNPQKRKEFWDALVTAGWLKPRSGFDVAGRMPTQYEVNPAVHDGRFREHHDRYAAQRGKYREIMKSWRNAE